MNFRILLFVLAIKLKLTALFSEEFRKRLRKMDFSLTISTEGQRGRTFIIKGGKVRSRLGGKPADTELVWCDPKTAVKTMLSSNELDAFSAIGRRKLRIFGNFGYALWFMDLAE